MNISVTKTQVSINTDYVLNDAEYNINECAFSFSNDYTDDLVKKAVFIKGSSIIEMSIINNKCNIPYEVLNQGQFEIHVYAYEVDGDDLVLRYSPSYTTAYVRTGSYVENAESPEEITPTQFEQYMQAMNDGLNEVANVNISSEQLSDGTSITITNREGVSNTTYVYNGHDGINGITPTIGDNGDWYLGETDTGKPSRGIQGEPGQNGADGFSPVASVSKSSNTATISITDKNGTTIATVSDGTNGVGVPTGGTEGQVLAKASGTDYDTEWVNASSGDLSNYYTKSDTDTLLNGKQNTLTAGTNMEITANNTINSTIKYFLHSSSKALRLGNDTNVASNSTAIGANAGTNSNNATAVGADSYANGNNVAVGNNAQSLWDHGIAIGNGARNSKNNQATFGSTASPINEARIMTSSGEKVLATESYVDTEISTALGTIETTLGGI